MLILQQIDIKGRGKIIVGKLPILPAIYPGRAAVEAGFFPAHTQRKRIAEHKGSPVVGFVQYTSNAVPSMIVRGIIELCSGRKTVVQHYQQEKNSFHSAAKILAVGETGFLMRVISYLHPHTKHLLIMKKPILLLTFLAISLHGLCWGFFGHKKINRLAVFMLPPEMLVLYKQHISFVEEHAVDPDKRRYLVAAEGPRHYIDIDRYGKWPYDSLPRRWTDAVAKYSSDTLQAYGIAPWWINTMLYRLTEAFKQKNQAAILKLSAETGHYIADAHVPLHATRNHNGQYTDQKGIHGFWESRIPELLADTEWDFLIGKADYLTAPSSFIWDRVLESAAAADTVLATEKKLSLVFPPDQQFAFEERNGVIIRQYSSAYTRAYDKALKGMTERRMRQSVYAVACFWYTAWVNAGQPDLLQLTGREFSPEDLKEFESMNAAWLKKNGAAREHE